MQSALMSELVWEYSFFEPVKLSSANLATPVYYRGTNCRGTNCGSKTAQVDECVSWTKREKFAGQLQEGIERTKFFKLIFKFFPLLGENPGL